MKKKEGILMAFNQVAQLDRVLYDILDVLMDLEDLNALPEVCRVRGSHDASDDQMCQCMSLRTQKCDVDCSWYQAERVETRDNDETRMR